MAGHPFRPDERPVRAAQYVRMSTEHQNYSIEYQSVANAAYALERGMQIVRTYTDAGISGVRLEKRDALKQLLGDVLGGRADFSVVLVYDVSRWGRFQDPDESAHYEFICRTAGVPIEYCAEPFASDGSITSAIVKQLKRAMAAEYSRELSGKVSRAKRGLSQKGYWCGGGCSYGLRRQLVRPDGSLGAVLGDGERKALVGQRIVLVAGPDHEVATVQRIFREYAIHGLGTTAIARRLNAEDVVGNRGRPWTRHRIWRLLTDEKYTGTRVIGRVTSYLTKVRPLPHDSWVRIPGACPALIDRRLFDLAQANIKRGPRGVSNEALLEDLCRVLALRGKLSGRIINEEGRHRQALYAKRFGTLLAAYELVGYQPDLRQRRTGFQFSHPSRARVLVGLSDADLIAGLRRLSESKGALTADLIDTDPDLPSTSTCRARLGDMMQICALVGRTPKPSQVRAYQDNARRRQSRGSRDGGRP